MPISVALATLINPWNFPDVGSNAIERWNSPRSTANKDVVYDLKENYTDEITVNSSL